MTGTFRRATNSGQHLDAVEPGHAHVSSTRSARRANRVRPRRRSSLPRQRNPRREYSVRTSRTGASFINDQIRPRVIHQYLTRPAPALGPARATNAKRALKPRRGWRDPSPAWASRAGHPHPRDGLGNLWMSLRPEAPVSPRHRGDEITLPSTTLPHRRPRSRADRAGVGDPRGTVRVPARRSAAITAIPLTWPRGIKGAGGVGLCGQRNQVIA